MAADDDIISKLRDARPSYQDGRGLRGNAIDSDLAVRLPATAPRFEFKTSATAPSAAFPSLPAAVPEDGGVPGAPSSAINFYSFELEDASDNEGFKVLIHDGQVFGPNDDGQSPSGMGSDDYILPIDGDGYKIYLIITQDVDTRDVTSITIDQAPTVPDDSPGVIYVEIGYVVIDDPAGSGLVPFNTLCGDLTLAYSLSVTGNNNNTDLPSVDAVNQINFSEAFEVTADPSPNPQAVFVETALSVEDEDGNTVSNVNDISFTTNGDPNIDLVVSPASSTGPATVTISTSADLQSLLDQLQDIIDNMVDCDDS
jgi:hypothetical protein